MLDNIEKGQKVHINCDNEIVEGVVRHVTHRELFVQFKTTKMTYDSKPYSKKTGLSRKLRINSDKSAIIAIIEQH